MYFKIHTVSYITKTIILSLNTDELVTYGHYWRKFGGTKMTSDRMFYESFVEALKVLGSQNVELVLHALEEEHVLSGGALNRERLEPALKSIFGDGAKVFLEIANNQKITR